MLRQPPASLLSRAMIAFLGPPARRDGGRRPCPRCGSTSRVSRKKADERISAPKGHGPRTPLGFWLKHAVRGDREGAEGAHHRPPSQPVCEGYAPVVAVLSRVCKKADECIPAPKGCGPRTPRFFSLHNRLFLGSARRGHHRLVGPLASRRLDGWARAMPPLWQYFLAMRRRSSPSPPPKEAPSLPLRGYLPANEQLRRGGEGGSEGDD
jgi:hypothetical protein